jgi:hypothetical protein
MPWNLTRRCPFCGSQNVARSERRDSFEKVVLALILHRPFRCLNCQERHYNFVFSKKMKLETSAKKSSPS